MPGVLVPHPKFPFRVGDDQPVFLVGQVTDLGGERRLMRAPALLLLGRALLATSRRFSPLAVAPPTLVFSNSSYANWLSFCQWCGCEWLTPISFNTTEPVFFGGASGVTLSRLFYFPHSRAAGRSALSLTPALLGRDAPVSTFGRFGGAQSSSGRIRCCPSAIPPNLWVSIP